VLSIHSAENAVMIMKAV